MSVFVTISDLVDVPQNQHNSAEINAHIDAWEQKLLDELMGGYYAEQFVNDYTGGGTFGSPDNQYIYDPFRWYGNPTGTKFVASEGIKQMLVDFITFYYIRKYDSKHTVSGVKKLKGELSDNQPLNTHRLVEIYNRAVVTHNAIVDYVFDNLSNYDGFLGRYKALMNIFGI